MSESGTATAPVAPSPGKQACGDGSPSSTHVSSEAAFQAERVRKLEEEVRNLHKEAETWRQRYAESERECTRARADESRANRELVEHKVRDAATGHTLEARMTAAELETERLQLEVKRKHDMERAELFDRSVKDPRADVYFTQEEARSHYRMMKLHQADLLAKDRELQAVQTVLQEVMGKAQAQDQDRLLAKEDHSRDIVSIRVKHAEALQSQDREHGKRVAELEGQLAEVQMQKATIHAEHEAIRSTHLQEQIRHAETAAKLRSREEDLHALKMELDESRLTNSTHEHTIAGLHRSHDAETAQLKAQHTAEAHRHELRADAFQGRSLDLNSALKACELTNRDLQEQVKHHRGVAMAREEELRQLRAEHGDALRAARMVPSDYLTENADLRSRVVALEDANAVLGRDLQEAKGEAEAHHKRSVEEQAHAAAFRAQLYDLESRHLEAQARLRVRNDQLEDRNLRLHNDLADSYSGKPGSLTQRAISSPASGRPGSGGPKSPMDEYRRNRAKQVSREVIASARTPTDWR